MSRKIRRISPLRSKYEGVGWALFLIFFGIMLAVPESWIPEGIGRLVVGVILLLYWSAGKYHKFEVSWLMLVAAIVLLASGISEMIGAAIALLPALLIVAGLVLLYKVTRADKKS